MARSADCLKVLVLLAGVAWSRPGRADIAQEPCSDLSNSPTCPSGDVGKSCPGNGGTCVAMGCRGDGGSTTVYLCEFTDTVGSSGCLCGISRRGATPLHVALTLAGVGAAFLIADNRRRRRPR